MLFSFVGDCVHVQNLRLPVIQWPPTNANWQTGPALTICQVGVSSDPSAVCRAPVHISGRQLQDILAGGCGVHHVATSCVENTLGLACTKRGAF